MNLLLVAVVAVALLLVGWTYFQSAQGRRREEEARGRVEQLQRDLQTLSGQTQNFSQQLGQLNVATILPDDVERSDVVINRAIDVRTACIQYLAYNICHDATPFGAFGTISHFYCVYVVAN